MLEKKSETDRLLPFAASGQVSDERMPSATIKRAEGVRFFDISGQIVDDARLPVSATACRLLPERGAAYP